MARDPICGMEVLPEEAAGAAMALSSVTVVTNALRLRSFRPTIEGQAA